MLSQTDLDYFNNVIVPRVDVADLENCTQVETLSESGEFIESTDTWSF